MTEEIIPAASEALQEYTYNSLIRLWLDNFAKNLKAIREGLNLVDIPKLKGQPLICVGGGPSLDRYKHLEMIKKAKWKHPIVTCDRKLNDCLQNNIIPYAVASIDGSPAVAKFYQTPLTQKFGSQINAVFSIMVHPNVVKEWKHKPYWFVGLLDDPKNESNMRSPTIILHILSKYKGIASGIGNVGSFLWNLGYILECDPIILVGYDFSEQVKNKADAIYFEPFVNLYMKHFKKEPSPENVQEAMDKSAAMHQVEHNPDFNTNYLVNPIWKSYREQLAMHIVTSKKHTIQCTGNGCLHTEAKNKEGNYILKCPNFEAAKLEEILERYD